MKKTHKKVLGFLGLSTVVAMTSVALALPNPEASAASSVTDTITVIVRATTPDVNISGIESGSTITEPEQSVEIDFANIDTLRIVLRYTNLDGVSQDFELANGPADGMPNPYPLSFDFSQPQYGYGKYVLIATGEGSDGVKDIDRIEFSFTEFDATLDEDEDNNKTYVDLDYVPDDGTEEGRGNVAKIILNVYNKKGNLVPELSPITVYAPENRVEVPFSDYDLDSGTYTIRVIAYDRDGEELFGKDLKKTIKGDDEEEDIPVPDAGTPDTGGLFKNISISQSDFLATGLIMFFVAGIAGVIVISRRNKNSKR